MSIFFKINWLLNNVFLRIHQVVKYHLLILILFLILIIFVEAKVLEYLLEIAALLEACIVVRGFPSLVLDGCIETEL